MTFFIIHKWYFVVVAVVGSVLFVLLRLYLQRFQTRGSGFIKKLRRFDSVRPKKGSKQLVSDQREQALENFESRFSIVKRTVLVVFGCSFWYFRCLIKFQLLQFLFLRRCLP